MDGKRFDDVARMLQARQDRRGVLQRALLIGAGGVLGLAGLAAVPEPTLA